MLADLGTRLAKQVRTYMRPSMTSPASNQQAYKLRSQTKIETCNTDQRMQDSDTYPDLDLHQTFGSYLTRKNPISSSVDPNISRYWDLLSNNPSLLQHYVHDISKLYRTAFRDFFIAEPVSLHGHVSDASSAALLTSLISHLMLRAPTHSRVSFFNEADKQSPRVAILEGSYGAGFGCLAYDAVLESVQPLGNGPRPIVIKTKGASSIDVQLKAAKNMGCIALITEIVRACDGAVISEEIWKNILRACKKHELILVVDEALTAIRCGAPFAYQLPQYVKWGFPDLVLFGKAVRTNGVAIEWRGINIQKLDIADRQYAILEWQERTTEIAQAANLLHSWGTLVLARREGWPQQAQKIGQLLRDIIVEHGIRASLIGGLHALIYLRLQDNKRFSSPVMGARASEHVRWFPVLDEDMTSDEELRKKVFGAKSIPHRKQLSAHLRRHDRQMRYCSRCGEAVGDDIQNCEVCVVRVCQDCEPDMHVCLMQKSIK